MKTAKMKYQMTLFHTMEPNRNVLFQIQLLFVKIYGVVWSSSVKCLTLHNVGPFQSPVLLRTLLYPVMACAICHNFILLKRKMALTFLCESL